jgi:large repetitive protein
MAIYMWKCLLIFTIATLALAIGCTGFFQNPTVTSISVSPSTNNLQIGGARPLTAIANNDDGSTKDVTGLAIWDTSDAAVVSVSSTGVIKGLQNTTSSITITAAYKGFSGTATVTVGGQTVTITCTSCSNNTVSLSGNGGTGTNINLSSNVAANWSSGDSAIISVSGTSTTNPTATLGGTTGTVTITANAASGSGSGTLQVTVNP